MRRRETLVQWSLAAVALSAIAVLALIIIFIFKEGSPIIARLGMAQIHRRNQMVSYKGHVWHTSDDTWFGLGNVGRSHNRSSNRPCHSYLPR